MTTTQTTTMSSTKRLDTIHDTDQAVVGYAHSLTGDAIDGLGLTPEEAEAEITAQGGQPTGKTFPITSRLYSAVERRGGMISWRTVYSAEGQLCWDTEVES